MAQTKITNVKALQNAIATLSAIDGYSPEEIEKLSNIMASYQKKSAGEKKPTETQLLNERIKVQIEEILADGVKRTVSDIVKALPEEYSNQKISALCSALWDKGNGSISRVEDKRKAYYFIEVA